MNFKTTGLLLALLVIIGLVWVFIPSSSREEETEGLEPTQPIGTEKPLLDPQPDSNTITRLTIERFDKPRLVFGRRPKPDQPEEMDVWKAVEPLAVPAENRMVNTLVSTFASLRSRSQFEAGSKGAPDEAAAGLSPPVATLTLADHSGKEYAFEVGRNAALSNDTYVRIAGRQTIHVAPRDLLADVKRDFNEYRDKKLCALTATDAVRVEIDAEGRACVLTRGEDQSWVLDSPVKAFAVRDEVLALLRKVSGLRAQEFIDDAPAALASYGLDEPYLKMKVTTEAKRELPAPEDESATQPAEPRFETIAETHGLAVGGFADLNHKRRYAKLMDQPWVVSVEQTDAEALIPDVGKLRDPQVTRVKAADVTKLEITSGGSSATLQGEQAGAIPEAGRVWQGTGDLAELEQAAVADVLNAFEDLRAIDYIDQPELPAKYGLDTPRAVLTVTAAGSVTPTVLRIGSDTASGRNTYVQRGDEPTVIVTSAAQAARLAVSLLALRSREIFTFPLESLRAVHVERGSARYTLVRDDKGWKLTEPADAPLDVVAARRLTTDLSRLRARRVVAKNDDAAYGLDRPVVTIRFEIEESPAATQPTTTQNVAAGLRTGRSIEEGPASTQAATTQSTQPTTAPNVATGLRTGRDEQPETRPTRIIEHTLRIGFGPGAAYARKDDDPYIFELDQTIYRVMTAELIDPRLFDFKPDEVMGVTVAATGGALALARQGEQWMHTPDPFVKLDQQKVKDFVRDLSQMRAEAYLAYRDGDLAAAGLEDAPATVTIRLADGEQIVMRMTQERRGELPRKAALVAERRIFRLREADCEKLLRGLDQYVEAEPSKEPEQPPQLPAQRP